MIDRRIRAAYNGKRIGFRIGVGVGVAAIAASFILCAVAPPVGILLLIAQGTLIVSLLSTMFITLPLCFAGSVTGKTSRWIFGIIPNIFGFIGEAIGELVGEALYDKKVARENQALRDFVPSTQVMNDALQSSPTGQSASYIPEAAAPAAKIEAKYTLLPADVVIDCDTSVRVSAGLV